MSFKLGETLWYERFPVAWKQIEHQKPWVKHGGPLLTEAGAILSLLPAPPLRVLDAGCGGGHLSHILSLCGYAVTGIDVCTSAINRANEMCVVWNEVFSTAKLRIEDFDKLPPNEWDAIVFASALHHSVNRRKTLASCFRALRTPGVLIASEPGLGHELGKGTKQWANDMNVTEKSTPPYKIIRDGKAVGFHSPRVYPNPVTLHKVAYSKNDFTHHPLIKHLIGITTVALAKFFHGITILHK